MKKTITLLSLFSLFISCAQEVKLDKLPLEEKFTHIDGKEYTFKNILEKHEGKTIFIDIWASWCSDCVKEIPNLKKFQELEGDVAYVMLSLDKSVSLWEKGVEKHELTADHYLFTNKWKESKFCEAIALDWIPRYMIVGKDGAIKMFKAVNFEDKKIKKVIEGDKSENNTVPTLKF